MIKPLQPTLNYFFLAICIGLLSYSAHQMLKLYKHQKNAIKTKGVLLKYNTKTGYAKLTKNRRPVHAPVYKFTSLKGEEFIIESIHFKEDKKYETGNQLEVLYMENNPRDAYITNNYPIRTYGYLFFAAFVGVLITIIPIIKKI